ncbi:hypothetical protein B484DRAFT_325042, partial [Ochromonadaceae sp. CCMP2298]
IREREETITDKEKRIYDLKKKNQELEKFRFVLDYKIKELKLQIAPRESEINTMRAQIGEMDQELEQYNKVRNHSIRRYWYYWCVVVPWTSLFLPSYTHTTHTPYPYHTHPHAPHSPIWLSA